MNERTKITLITIVAVMIGIAAFAYGALTATPARTDKSPSPTPTSVKKVDLDAQLKSERKTIIGVLTAAYPRIKTDYAIANGKLYEQGQWYGTTLTYHGKDTMNRDTLRVLMEKQHGVWTLLTKPPEPLLSANEFPDVPKSVLQAINQPVSLPGVDDSPKSKS